MKVSETGWQPLTPAGVAAFARARLRHLLIVQLIVALIAGGMVVYFAATSWFPPINAAIQALPDQGAIRGGRLSWTAKPAQLLSENHFLALAVDLAHSGQVRSPAHIQVEFGASNLRIYSLFGLLEQPYPRGWIIAFNRAELQPWWGAWSPALLAGLGALVVVWLFFSWACLATLYSCGARLIGFFADRDLSWAGSWKLSGAALMPGALFLVACIFLYSLGGLDLVRLLAAVAAHFLIGWVYVIACPHWCPRIPNQSAAGANPFTPSVPNGPTAAPAMPERPQNSISKPDSQARH